jgi:hypothetical protein
MAISAYANFLGRLTKKYDYSRSCLNAGGTFASGLPQMSFNSTSA